MSNRVYDRLRGLTLDGLTRTQMNSVLENVTIDSIDDDVMNASNVLNSALLAQSGVVGGVPFQDQGAVTTIALADATPSNSKPAGETWHVHAISIQNNDAINAAVVTLTLTDGSTGVTIYSANLAGDTTTTIDLGVVSSPFYWTPNLYLQASQTGESSGVYVDIAYNIVQT